MKTNANKRMTIQIKILIMIKTNIMAKNHYNKIKRNYNFN